MSKIKLMICPAANNCLADCKLGHNLPHHEIGSRNHRKDIICPGCKEIED